MGWARSLNVLKSLLQQSSLGNTAILHDGSLERSMTIPINSSSSCVANLLNFSPDRSSTRKAALRAPDIAQISGPSTRTGAQADEIAQTHIEKIQCTSFISPENHPQKTSGTHGLRWHLPQVLSCWVKAIFSQKRAISQIHSSKTQNVRRQHSSPPNGKEPVPYPAILRRPQNPLTFEQWNTS